MMMVGSERRTGKGHGTWFFGTGRDFFRGGEDKKSGMGNGKAIHSLAIVSD